MSVNDAPDVNMDRLLTDWLEADAAPRAPESLETAFVEGVASTRQRPAWATTERWISMETRAQLGVMPRAVILLLTIALLAATFAVSLAIGGSFTRANDGGEPLAGLTYHSLTGVYQHQADGIDDRVRLIDEGENAGPLFWSPDGERFAYLSWSEEERPTTVWIRDADGSNPIVASEPFGPGPPPIVTWSPDGSRIAYSIGGSDAVDEEAGCELDGSFCGHRIWSAPADGSEMAKVIGDPTLDACDAVWTPDGASIIFSGSPAGSGDDRGVYRMDADGTNAQRIGELTGTSCWWIPHSISPDGTTLAVSTEGEGSDIHLVDLATGESVLITGEEADEFGPLWSPDGSLLAFSRYLEDGFDVVEEAMLYEAASGESISIGKTGEVTGWSPDGRFIIGRNLDGIMTLVDVSDPTAPVSTEVEGVEGDRPTWQPRP